MKIEKSKETDLSLDSRLWKLLKPVLYPFSWVYGAIVLGRNLAYNAGWLRTLSLTTPVISIGNLSAGGTGKTPVTMALTRLLKSPMFRCRPAVLSRGYKRKTMGYHQVSSGKGPTCSWTEAGDEPYLMAQSLRGVPVAVDEDRFRGATELTRRFKPDVILLDDAFQHRRLHRDLDIVLLDSSRDLSDTLLPAGRLREPLSSLRRAGLIILTHFKPDDQVYETAWKACARTFGGNRLMACRTNLSGCRDLHSGKSLALSELNGLRLVPFCGVAKPESFLAILESTGAEFPFLVRLPDHHVYGPKDVERLAEAFARTRASYLMTTEKDAVKLEGLFTALPILVLEIEIEWLRGRENLERELFKLFT